MSTHIWIDNSLLFKIAFTNKTQYVCICSEEYKNQLNMNIGDIVFMKDATKLKSYRRLGKIKAFDGRKIIVSAMCDIGTFTKSKMVKLLKDSC